MMCNEQLTYSQLKVSVRQSVSKMMIWEQLQSFSFNFLLTDDFLNQGWSNLSVSISMIIYNIYKTYRFNLGKTHFPFPHFLLVLYQQRGAPPLVSRLHSCSVLLDSLDLDNQAACHHTSLTLTTVCLVWTAGYGNLLDFYDSNWLSGSNMWKEEVVLSSLRG